MNDSHHAHRRARGLDRSRAGRAGWTQSTDAAKSGELLTLELRYADATGSMRRQSLAVVDDVRRSVPSPDFNFAAAVAEYGMILQDSPHKGAASYDAVLALAEPAARSETDRARFVELVRRTRKI